MDEIGLLILFVVLPSAVAFGFGEAVGERSERKEIAVQCERIGSVIINGTVYECRVKGGAK